MKSLHILKKAPWLTAIALGLGLTCISSGFAAGSSAYGNATPKAVTVTDYCQSKDIGKYVAQTAYYGVCNNTDNKVVMEKSVCETLCVYPQNDPTQPLIQCTWNDEQTYPCVTKS